MLVSEWSLHGHIVWCDASPRIQEQLNSVLHDVKFCDIQSLSVVLLGEKYVFLK